MSDESHEWEALAEEFIEERGLRDMSENELYEFLIRHDEENSARYLEWKLKGRDYYNEARLWRFLASRVVLDILVAQGVEPSEPLAGYLEKRLCDFDEPLSDTPDENRA